MMPALGLCGRLAVGFIALSRMIIGAGARFASESDSLEVTGHVTLSTTCPV